MKKTTLLSALIACALPSAALAMQNEPCTLEMHTTAIDFVRNGESALRAYGKTPYQSYVFELRGIHPANMELTLKEHMEKHPGTRELTLEFSKILVGYDFVNGKRNPSNPAIWPK